MEKKTSDIRKKGSRNYNAKKPILSEAEKKAMLKEVKIIATDGTEKFNRLKSKSVAQLAEALKKEETMCENLVLREGSVLFNTAIDRRNELIHEMAYRPDGLNKLQIEGWQIELLKTPKNCKK